MKIALHTGLEENTFANLCKRLYVVSQSCDHVVYSCVYICMDNSFQYLVNQVIN